MISKKSLGIIGLGIIAAFSLLCFFYPVFLQNETPKPQPRIYSYYEIVDIATGKTLMFVSSAPVFKGDELITGDNKRYMVVKVIKNKAYAKYIERVQLKSSNKK